MQERYGIADDDLVGEVLWHSLNESGEIGVYDMKFGNTIVRNLTEADIEPVTVNEHMHAVRDTDEKDSGKKRGKKRGKT